MPVRLDSRAADFPASFRTLLAQKREAMAEVEAAVRSIIADVALRGDRALVELSRRFDRVHLGELGIKVAAEEIDSALAACDPKTPPEVRPASPRETPGTDARPLRRLARRIACA